jgi:hypothetical protein
MGTRLDLEEVLWRAIDLLKGLLPRLWHGLHLELDLESRGREASGAVKTMRRWGDRWRWSSDRGRCAQNRVCLKVRLW